MFRPAYELAPFAVLQNIANEQRREMEHHRRRLRELEVQNWYEYGRAVFFRGETGWKSALALAASKGPVDVEATTQVSFQIWPHKHPGAWLMRVATRLNSWEAYVDTSQLVAAFAVAS
jgi:hypothetical protein